MSYLPVSTSTSISAKLATLENVVPSRGYLSLAATTRPWPANASNWMLQYQSNPPSVGLGSNWMLIPGPVTNPFLVPTYSNAGSVIYRLKTTN